MAVRFAVYLYLSRKFGGESAHLFRCEGGLVIDYAADGRPIGVEINAPQSTSLDAVNRVLATAQLPPVSLLELQPLISAAA